MTHGTRHDPTRCTRTLRIRTPLASIPRRTRAPAQVRNKSPLCSGLFFLLGLRSGGSPPLLMSPCHPLA
jgi:hypothetical protein